MKIITLPVILACFSLSAAFAVPNAEVKITDSGKGYQIVRHEGRSFGLNYEKDMERFAAADKSDPRTGGIVCTGSSSMVGWRTISKDLAPLPAVNRGFGGSASPQLWWYADRAVLARRPRLVLVYIGDNDTVQASVSPGNYMKYVRLFRDEVWAQDPATRIIFLSIKPSRSRWAIWPKTQDANRRLARMCSRDPRLTYVDIGPTLLNEKGEPQDDLFLPDKLHLKPESYARWTAVVRPVVEKVWAEIQAGK